MTSNQINYWKLKEQERSNKVDEAERNRSNLERESQGRKDLQIKQKQLLSNVVLGLADRAQNLVDRATPSKQASNALGGIGKLLK